MQDTAFHESKTHGKTKFPYTVYKGDIPKFINSFPLHWHDEMEFIYIADGIGVITVQSTKYNVHSGDIIIVPSQTVHAIERNGNYSMQYYNILFSLSILDNADDVCHKKFFEPLYLNEVEPIFHAPKNSELNALLSPHIKYLIDNRHDLSQNCELLIKSELFAILHHTLSFTTPTVERKHIDTSNYDKLKKLLLYVREHYSEQISVKTAADICAYSCSHFMKIFKGMTGQSFTEYLVNFRLDAAANALALSSHRIIDIAYNCGFENISYFSRAFLKKYGITPSEYRKKSVATQHD